MEKPYYDIDQETAVIILELMKKCMELDLGNISFHYFANVTDFYLNEYKNYWELVVKLRQSKTTDIFRIDAGKIIYQYSEKDQ